MHYALRVKKIYQHDLEVGLSEFQFLRPRKYLTNPFRTLSLFFGIIGKPQGLTSCNNFVKQIFVCICHRDNVLARCDSKSLRKKKHAQNFLFHKYYFRIRRTTVLGRFKDYAIILNAIRLSFLNKSATTAMFTSVRIHFGWPTNSSFSTSSLPCRNREYHIIIIMLL